MSYSWAVNKSKEERAIKEVRGDNVLTGETGTNPVTEEAVKKVYIRLLGLVAETGETPVEATERVNEGQVKPRKKKK